MYFIIIWDFGFPVNATLYSHVLLIECPWKGQKSKLHSCGPQMAPFPELGSRSSIVSECGSNTTAKKKQFPFHLSERLNNTLTAGSNIWMTRKHKGNDTLPIRYETLVSDHQPDVYFLPPCFSVIWCQLGNSCIKLFLPLAGQLSWLERARVGIFFR